MKFLKYHFIKQNKEFFLRLRCLRLLIVELEAINKYYIICYHRYFQFFFFMLFKKINNNNNNYNNINIKP